MGMNNVFYSAKGNMGDDFANERAGLRMNVIANPGVDKADFDLWSFAVSAIGHCEFCTAAHAEDCLKAGISKEGVMDALRIAATTAQPPGATGTGPRAVVCGGEAISARAQARAGGSELDLRAFHNRGIGLGSVGLDLLTRELG